MTDTDRPISPTGWGHAADQITSGGQQPGSRAGAERVPARTLDDWRTHVRADARANGATALLQSCIRDPIQRWLVVLRTLEYLDGCRHRTLGLPLRVVLIVYFQRLSIWLGFTIPPGTCGPGLSLPHHGTIIVNGEARLGPRCCLHPGVTIGSSRGQVPKIGSDVTLDPGAKVFGAVVMADGSRAAANAVVTSDVPAGEIAFGVPATARPRRP